MRRRRPDPYRSFCIEKGADGSFFVSAVFPLPQRVGCVPRTSLFISSPFQGEGGGVSPAAMPEQLWCRSPRGGGLPFFARAKKGNPKVWPRRASMRGPDIRTSLYIKSTPRSRRNPLRFSPKAGPARRHIPVPLAGSRSRREPRYARPDPPSAAMLGGGYGSRRQNREMRNS